PLQTSFCTRTEPTSVRTNDQVGHASRQPASAQCLQTSDKKTQRKGSSNCGAGKLPVLLGPDCGLARPIDPVIWFPFCRSCSRNMTWRQVDAPRWPVLS